MIIVTNAKVIRRWVEVSGQSPKSKCLNSRRRFLVRLSLSLRSLTICFWGLRTWESLFRVDQNGQANRRHQSFNMCWICLFVLHFFVVCLFIFMWVSRLWLVNGRKVGEETLLSERKGMWLHKWYMYIMRKVMTRIEKYRSFYTSECSWTFSPKEIGMWNPFQSMVALVKSDIMLERGTALGVWCDFPLCIDLGCFSHSLLDTQGGEH